MKPPIFQRSRAFTLLELMVALALLGLVVAGIYSSWLSIIKGREAAMKAAAEGQRTRITMRTLQDSLLCACMYGQNLSYYSFIADADGDLSSLSFVAHLPKSFPRSGKFGDLAVRRLSFTIESGLDGRNQLVLRQQPLLMEMDKDEREHPLVLAKDVEQFAVEFTDPRTGEWTSEWTATNQLPRKVRVTVGLGRTDLYNGSPSEQMVGTVALPAELVRPEWQAPMNAFNPVPGPPGATNVPGGVPRGPEQNQVIGIPKLP